MEFQIVCVGNGVGYGRCSLGPAFWIGNVGGWETCDFSRTSLESSTTWVLLGPLSFPIRKSSMVNLGNVGGLLFTKNLHSQPQLNNTTGFILLSDHGIDHCVQKRPIGSWKNAYQSCTFHSRQNLVPNTPKRTKITGKSEAHVGL